MTAPVRIVVAGRPQTQGNHRQSRHGKTYDSNPRLKAWRSAVSWAAKTAMAGREKFVNVPLVMDVVFYVDRGGSAFSEPIAHQLGDCTKMVRAAEDSLTGLVYDDDSRIVKVVALKQYATRKPGALITVRMWQPSDASTAIGSEVG